MRKPIGMFCPNKFSLMGGTEMLFFFVNFTLLRIFFFQQSDKENQSVV